MENFIIRKVYTGYKFDLYAANGQEIATSEVYETMAACRKGIESVRKNAPNAKLEIQWAADRKEQTNPKFEAYRDKSGEYRFRLRSRNGKIIAVSDGYSAKNACLSGIESVIRNAPDAVTETI